MAGGGVGYTVPFSRLKGPGDVVCCSGRRWGCRIERSKADGDGEETSSGCVGGGGRGEVQGCTEVGGPVAGINLRIVGYERVIGVKV